MSALLLCITGLLCGILMPWYTSAQHPREIRDGCDLLWEENNVTHFCYQFNLQSALSWEAARESCQAQGGDLLSIMNLAEQNHISEKLKNVDTMVWIGLNQLDGLFGWQWSDGAALAFVNWKTNSSPWFHERRHCGTYSGGGEHKWHSTECESKLPYACKKYLTPRPRELYEHWRYYPTQCTSDWIPFNRRCCKLQKEELGWSEASAACHSDGGELMSVNSLADVEFLVHLLDDENVSEAWIGMSSNHIDPAEFQWSDGSAVTFTSWQRHEPKITLEGSDLCASAHRGDGNWKVRPCRRKLPSVCKKPGLSETVDDNDDEKCAEGWVRHGAYCYGTDLRDKTFMQAVEDSSCHPATISNRFEQAFINSLISNNLIPGDSYFWIALQDINKTGEYSWLVNSKEDGDVSFTHWDTQEPSHNGGCVVLSSGSMGHWNVKDCERFSAKSLCKVPLTANVERELNLHEGFMDQTCAPSWDTEPHLHHCYKVFHHEKLMRKRTWQEAEDTCQDFGAHLVSLSNLEEEQFVEELISSMFNGDRRRKFWIGFNKRNPSSNDSWEWSDKSPVVSSFWHDAHPSDVSMSCAAYGADKQLMPLNCNTEEEWICKIPKGVIPKTPDWHIQDIPWVFHHGHNYCFYDINAHFDVARFICDMMQSGITSILSEEEQAFIHRRIKKEKCLISRSLTARVPANLKNVEQWYRIRATAPFKSIGLPESFYSSVSGNPIDLKVGKATWSGFVMQFWKPKSGLDHKSRESIKDRWGDGSFVTYSNWKTDPQRDVNSSTTAGGRQCAYIESDTGLWSFSDCFSPNSAICKTNLIFKMEKHYTPVENDHDQEYEICPKDWLYYGNKCFFVYKDGQMDWYSASNYCREHGGGLATITNGIEQAFIVMQLFGEKNGFWIGVGKIDYDLWENGTAETYNNWTPAQYTHKDVNDQDRLCALISANQNVHPTGKWYLEKCSPKGYGFICEKEQDISDLVVSSSDMFPVSESMEYGDKTYRIISGNMSWYDASAECQEYGGNLASITDQYHQAFVTILVHRLGYPHWIGSYSADSNDDFNGATSQFTSWADEESPSDGNCVYTDTSGYWRAEDCDTELQGALCLPSTGHSVSMFASGIYTARKHFIIPIAVVSTMLITISLWYLLKRKRSLSSQNIQRLQYTPSSPETDDAELCIPITD